MRSSARCGSSNPSYRMKPSTGVSADAAGHLARRRRGVLHAYRGAVPARPKPPVEAAREPNSIPVRISAGVENYGGAGETCGGNAGGVRRFAQTQHSRYNGKNNPTSVPGHRSRADRPITEVCRNPKLKITAPETTKPPRYQRGGSMGKLENRRPSLRSGRQSEIGNFSDYSGSAATFKSPTGGVLPLLRGS